MCGGIYDCMKYVITESQYRKINEQSKYEEVVLKLVKRLYIDTIEDVREKYNSQFFFSPPDEPEMGEFIALTRLENGTLYTFTRPIKYDIKKFLPNVSSDDINDAILELLKEKYPELRIKRIRETENYWYDDFEASEHP